MVCCGVLCCVLYHLKLFPPFPFVCVDALFVLSDIHFANILYSCCITSIVLHTGTEPLSYYLLNGFLNFSIAFPLSFLALPVIVCLTANEYLTVLRTYFFMFIFITSQMTHINFRSFLENQINSNSVFTHVRMHTFL